MRRPMLLACAALGLASLSGCADGYYGRTSVGWSAYSYGGWYDGYYGPFYDGYWGSDGFFWFRLSLYDTRFRRDDRRHFQRENPRADPRYRRFDRTMPQRPPTAQMPSFPRQDQGRDRDNRDRKDRRPD